MAYGRLEMFRWGLWSNVCDREGFTPESVAVACTSLGYDGGARLKLKVRPT